ncbi:MAG: hypothetical protein WBA74_19445 [Cyclobacteriaceae bacterium]
MSKAKEETIKNPLQELVYRMEKLQLLQYESGSEAELEEFIKNSVNNDFTKDIDDEANRMALQADLAKWSYESYNAILTRWSDYHPTIIEAGDLLVISIIIDNQMFLAYRGSANSKNWFRDLQYSQIEARPVSKNYAHKGFVAGYNNIRGKIRQHLENQFSGGNLLGLHICGHSLGGALANLCALDMVNNPISGVKLKECVTFGQPRVGNKKFAKECDKKIGKSQHKRYINSYKPFLFKHTDPVPGQPPVMITYMTIWGPRVAFYQHSGKDYRIVFTGKDNQLIYDQENIDISEEEVNTVLTMSDEELIAYCGGYKTVIDPMAWMAHSIKQYYAVLAEKAQS